MSKTDIAKSLDAKGYILRSGGASGADTAFENGAGEHKAIYLPWKNFNSNYSQYNKPSKDAFELAATIHPVWNELSYGAKALHARNCHQVLGTDLNRPSDFLICWTLGGGIRGGTATAMRLALENNVPVFNLASNELSGLTCQEIISLLPLDRPE